MDKFKKKFNEFKDGLKDSGPHDARGAQDKPQDAHPDKGSNGPAQGQPAQMPMNSQPNRQPGQPVTPRIKGEPRLLGLVGDPGLNRDSGGSVRFGNRVFWTYRDTQLCNSDGSVRMFPIISSTASWSDYSKDGGPDLQPARGDPLRSVVLRQYGKNQEAQSFFHNMPHICDAPAGNKNDGTRIALWPDSPPLVTEETSDGKIKAYTWVKQAHIGHDLSVKTEHPATILYRTDYHPSMFHSHHDLPKVTAVDEQFWKPGEIAHGSFGNVIKDGVAYLYGREKHITSLARVPVHEIENRHAYEYWVNGTWTKNAPSIAQEDINIPNACAGGQGTYYFNEHWQCYVWIGGDPFPGAEMYISTAPEPQGPWLQPQMFYTGPRGNHPLGAYSVQAHPSLTYGEKRNGMYLTYTKNDEPERGDIAGYTTPLIYVEFE
ncbi:hypothetical protein HII31_09048 [Pseudocercospora fuligena]|uniref:DUF4185 domain-containing protein n=1 Tax=Pseudocercospora fuligena TaxID=685502 RepID=A0A8H6RES1_9PEZI|nr:hypothetical protein HII31_09048 [Pseudocercospora fuligena]